MTEIVPRRPRPKPVRKPKWDDPEESKRFLETAKDAEASEDPKEFDRALSKVISRAGSKGSSR